MIAGILYSVLFALVLELAVTEPVMMFFYGGMLPAFGAMLIETDVNDAFDKKEIIVANAKSYMETALAKDWDAAATKLNPVTEDDLDLDDMESEAPTVGELDLDVMGTTI